MGGVLTVSFHDHKVKAWSAKKPAPVKCSECNSVEIRQMYYQCTQTGCSTSFCESCVAFDVQCDANCNCHVASAKDRPRSCNCCANGTARLPAPPPPADGPDGEVPAYYDVDQNNNIIAAPPSYTEAVARRSIESKGASWEDEQGAVEVVIDSGNAVVVTSTTTTPPPPAPPTETKVETSLSRVGSTFTRTRTLTESARVVLAEQDEETVPCPVCFGEYGPSQMKRMRTCRHFFCQDCFRAFVVDSLKDISKYPMRCAIHDCTDQVDYRDIQDILTPEQLSVYDSFLIKASFRTTATQAVTCSNNDCDKVLVIEKSELKNRPRQTCPYCRTVFCAHCNIDWHEGQTCEQKMNEGKIAESAAANDQLFEDVLSKKGWQRCPVCGQPIEKVSGCNHMTHKKAQGCKSDTHFCAQCGIQLSNRNHKNDMNEKIHLSKGYFGDCVVTQNGGKKNASNPATLSRTLSRITGAMNVGDDERPWTYYAKGFMVEYFTWIDIIVWWIMFGVTGVEGKDGEANGDQYRATIAFLVIGSFFSLVGFALWLSERDDGEGYYQDNENCLARLAVQCVLWHFPIYVINITIAQEFGVSGWILYCLVVRALPALVGALILLFIISSGN